MFLGGTEKLLELAVEIEVVVEVEDALGVARNVAREVVESWTLLNFLRTKCIEG